MDTKELENNIVTSGGSVIKQRINLLLQAVQGDSELKKVKADIAGARMSTGGEPQNQTAYN